MNKLKQTPQVVHICVYVYMCVYACICIWMRMCVYDIAWRVEALLLGFSICAYVCICMRMYMCVHVCVYSACEYVAASVFADVYVGVKTHLCNIHTCPCTSAQTPCKVHVTLLRKNTHTYIPTHKCIRIHMHTKTHAHAWHRPHAEALIPRPTIYAQICIRIHMHTCINA